MDYMGIPGVSITYGKGGLKTNLNINSADLIAKITHNLFKDYSSSDEIKSADTAQLTSGSLVPFRDLLYDTSIKYNKALEVLNSCNSDLESVTLKQKKLNRSIFRFFYKKKISSLEDVRWSLEESQIRFKEDLDKLNISLEIDTDDEFSNLYDLVRDAFSFLKLSAMKWDITSSKFTNYIAERTSATSTITRSVINIENRELGLLNCSELPMVFQNMNGGNLYFFPGFLIYHNSNNKFAVIDYIDLNIEFRSVRFIEDEAVPKDSEVIGQTWSKVNKDGSPDRRFSNNKRIPIVQYGEIYFNSSTGLNEVFCFSNHDAARVFGLAFNNYISALRQAASLLEQFKS